MTEVFDIGGTSPASASTATGGACSGLAKFGTIRVDLVLQGATDGALDVYLQRKVHDNLWADWAHFTQLAAAASAVAYTLTVVPATSSGTISSDVVTPAGTDATPAPALAAGFSAVHPGDWLRVVYVAGAGTSAGAEQKIRVTGIGPSR
jgi:hypothetical protein